MGIEQERGIETLRDDIEVTRQRISGELEAIGERLTPEHAKRIAKEKIVEAKDRAIENVRIGARRAARVTKRTGGELGDAIRENPIPTIMVGVGAGWILWNAIHRARTAVDEQMELPLPEPGIGEAFDERRRFERAKDRFTSVAHSARERTREAAHNARERTKEMSRTALTRSNDAYSNNPLLFGAVAVAAGLAIGMMIPSTEREKALLGAGRERLMNRAKDYVREVEDVAAESAREGLRAARRNIT